MKSLSEVTPCPSAVIITGGSSGIGETFLEHVLRDTRADLVCNISRRKPAEKLFTPRLIHLPADLTEPDQLASAATELLRLLDAQTPAGPIWLINNSGWGLLAEFSEGSRNQQINMIDLNIRAVVDLTARLLPTIRARRGIIVTIASTAAFQPLPRFSVYAATKAFVLHWSLALREELKGQGVNVLAVCPGPTESAFFERTGLKGHIVPPGLSQTSEAVVRATAGAMVAGKGLIVSGWTNKLSAFLAGCAPRTWSVRIAAIFMRSFRERKGN